MWHKPYIYLVFLSFVIWIVNYLIIKDCRKNGLNDSLSVIAMIYWGPLAFTFGIIGLILKW